ncbi:MAG: NMD3-related protein [Candidatus Micrarchaeia archaeon]
MPIYCPLCNNSSDKVRFVGNFCIDCTIKRLKSVVPDSVDLYQCPSCGKVSANGRDFEDLSNEFFSKFFSSLLHDQDYKAKLLRYADGIAEVRFDFKVESEDVEFEKSIKVNFKKRLCEFCSRKKSKYYEVVVQLRGNLVRLSNVMAKIERFVESRGGFVAEVLKVSNGFDMHISSKEIMNEFFLLNKKYKPKKSYVFKGIKNNKRQFRNIYSLRFE